MRRFLLHIFLFLAVLTFSSCNAIKNFLNTNLEDEDYIVGQLYADEYVKEIPLRITPSSGVAKANGNIASGESKTGIVLTDKDNKALYAAIDAWYGTPYQYGGCSTSGVDCSCFVGNVFKTVYGVSLNRIASDIQKDVFPIGRKNLREGDIVFFVNSNKKVSHVGIYLKDNLFVHSSTSSGVIVSSLENSYWDQHFYKGGRHKAVKTKY